jgi:glycerate 2-kinase
MELRLRHISDITASAINAVKPAALIPRAVLLHDGILTVGGVELDLDSYHNIFVVGAGKASAYMAAEMERILGERLTGGTVTVKYGHTTPCTKIEVREAGHPVPDENGLEATRAMLELVDAAGESDLVLCLFSGGGSALLEVLPDTIPPGDLQQTIELLLASGVTIDEMNCIRKHLSLVKGGRLAGRIAPARCVALIISDVIGDPVGTIASGPTAADPTTFRDAIDILEKHGLMNDLPGSIREHLNKGMAGDVEETVKPGEHVVEAVDNIIIGNNHTALQAADTRAKELGYNSLLLTGRYRGEAREVAKIVASIVEEINERDLPAAKPACILLGGESTVTIRGDGKGGRNQELALATLVELKRADFDYAIACFGTDGTDGPTDAAGAVITPEILVRAEREGIEPERYLKANDSYTFFKRTDGLLVTGPTGTNVMDLIVALV